MNADARELRQTIASLENNAKTLESSMLSLSSCWEGPTWEAFRQVVANDTVYMNQLIKYLKNYADRLEASATLYTYGEQDAAMKAKTTMIW